MKMFISTSVDGCLGMGMFDGKGFRVVAQLPHPFRKMKTLSKVVKTKYHYNVSEVLEDKWFARINFESLVNTRMFTYSDYLVDEDGAVMLKILGEAIEIRDSTFLERFGAWFEARIEPYMPLLTQIPTIRLFYLQRSIQ